jgi:pectinesterase
MRLRIFHIITVFVLASISCKTREKAIYDEFRWKIDYVVAEDRSGDFTTLTDAVRAAPANSKKEVFIFIKKGNYHEKLIIPDDKPNLTFIGEDADSTVISYSDRSVYIRELNTFTSHSVRLDASDITFCNLTIRNTETASQAVALHGNGDRQRFIHCKILGWQDTYYSDMRSRNYFRDCYLEGAVDFIFGFGLVLFDSCRINSLGGFVTAASTPREYNFGMVFRNCHFTSSPELKPFSLGRPWFAYARTVLIDCYEAGGLLPEGWSTWDGRENTCFYREYKCYGPGSDRSSRAFFGKQLTEGEAKSYTPEYIFSRDNFPAGDEDYSAYLESRFKGHKAEPYLYEIVFRADGKWPDKPAENWDPVPYCDRICSLIYKHVKPFNTVI